MSAEVMVCDPIDEFSSLEVRDSLLCKIKQSSYGMKRSYSTIDISADKWLLVNNASSIEKLENPPSLAHGLSRDLEKVIVEAYKKNINSIKEIRYVGCEFIQLGAILLKLPQTAAATGQILFHRYYYQKSFVRYNFEVRNCFFLYQILY